MRRTLFTLLATGALLALGPATALAHQHHHRSRHHARHHARIHRERWGSNDGQQQGSSSSEDAGAIASFTNGVLTIKLNDNSMVSGKVTDSTELECRAAQPTVMENDDHGRGDDGNNGDDNDNDQGEDQTEGEQNCAMGSLTSGTVVHEAELKVSSAGAIWDKLELITMQSAASQS